MYISKKYGAGITKCTILSFFGIKHPPLSCIPPSNYHPNIIPQLIVQIKKAICTMWQCYFSWCLIPSPRFPSLECDIKFITL